MERRKFLQLLAACPTLPLFRIQTEFKQILSEAEENFRVDPVDDVVFLPTSKPAGYVKVSIGGEQKFMPVWSE